MEVWTKYLMIVIYFSSNECTFGSISTAWIYFGTFLISVFYWGFHGTFQSGPKAQHSAVRSKYGAVIADTAEDDMHE
jgi:hypothetical protein